MEANLRFHSNFDKTRVIFLHLYFKLIEISSFLIKKITKSRNFMNQNLDDQNLK